MMGAFMTLEESLAVGAAKTDADSHEPYSVDWWESRTATQLRDIIKRGFAGGPEFPGAVAEIERRARVETSRLRELAALEALNRTRRKKIIWGIAASALPIAVLLGFWFGR
jgi:outer membrane protein TolC